MVIKLGFFYGYDYFRILIFIINLIGGAFSFHIGLNVGTSILVGILGIPGVILLIILKIFML